MPNKNLFTTICEEVADIAKPSEAYLIAGTSMEIFGTSEAVRKAVSKSFDATGVKPLDALIQAYNTCPAAVNPMFADGSVGRLEKDGVCVEFSVRKIDNSPDVYRVLFSRIDSCKLLSNLDKRVEELIHHIHHLGRDVKM